MPTHRISVDIDEQDHKNLKVYCATFGFTIKDFVLKSVLEKLENWPDDKWTERIKKRKKTE